MHANSFSVIRADTCGQTDGQDELNRSFLRLCTRAQKSKEKKTPITFTWQ